MSNFDDLALPDNGFETRGSRQLLWDVWYVLRSKTGLGKLLELIAERSGSRPIPVYDQYGKAVGTTSKDAEASWNKANFAGVRSDLAALKKQVSAISAPTVTLTDAQVASLAQKVASALPHIPATDEFAKAVATELAARLSKGA